MRILYLAPHPVFQERGSPIAAKLALTVLSDRPGTTVDLLSYAEGTDITLPNVTHYRAWTPRIFYGVPPGASLLKLVHDFFFFIAALRLLWAHRNSQYHLVHAVEEAAFMAVVMKFFFGVPYAYDMDSSMALQILERWPFLSPISPVLYGLESFIISHAYEAIPMCNALADTVTRITHRRPLVLSDISLLDTEEGTCAVEAQKNSLKREFKFAEKDLMVLYVGNLEPYQGIDLLLQSFLKVIPVHEHCRLVIVGGREDHVRFYREWVRSHHAEQRIHLTGSRPLPLLDAFLKEADVLISSRTLGNNTPMKIYSYLHSGKALVATNLSTHTQVMDSTVAELADPNPDAFSKALLRVLTDEVHRSGLGRRARELAERKFTFRAFRETLNKIYDSIENRRLPNPESKMAANS